MKRVANDPLGSEILGQLQSLDPYDQYFAVLTICDLKRAELLPAVVPLIQSRYADLRYLVVQTIGDLGGADSKFYGPFLVPLLESKDPELRQYAAEALGALDYQEAIPAIERMVRRESDVDTQLFSNRALRMLKGEALPEDRIPVFRMHAVELRRDREPSEELSIKLVH